MIHQCKRQVQTFFDLSQKYCEINKLLGFIRKLFSFEITCIIEISLNNFNNSIILFLFYYSILLFVLIFYT